MYKRIILTVTLVLMVVLTGCQKQADSNIATVNGQAITQSEYDKYYNLIKNNYEQQRGSALDETADKDLIETIKSSTFDDLVMQKLLRQEAQKQSITVKDEDIDNILNPFKESKNAEEDNGYQKFLDSMQVSDKDIRNQIEISILYDKLLDKIITDVVITDEEVQQYYKENESMFKDPGGIQIYHILVDSDQLAKEIISRLKQGEDFAALAAKYSADPGSKEEGGDVGLVNENTNFVPEFKAAALALKPGQLNPVPVKSEYGYHVIKAGDKVTPSQVSYDEVKDDLKNQMEMDEKNSKFEAYLQNLKDSADVKDLRNK